MPRRRQRSGIVGRVLDGVEERTGQRLVPDERVELLESIADDYRSLRREMEDLGWAALNYLGGKPQEPTLLERRKAAQRARVTWMRDPMAGAAVDKLNDFVFGRGISKPRAKDPEVQEVIDEAWDDPDNQRVLTTAQAQRELGTDFGIQSNLFFLLFDEGEDGKVKLGVLEHDSVCDIVTDPENRLRPLWYVAEQRKVLWDFKTDQARPDLRNTAKKFYYEHWQNVTIAEEEKGDERDEPLEKPDDSRLGEGRVYHMATNKGMEQQWGITEFLRTTRWFSAYNEFMASRVDMTKAAAAFVMKRTLKGGTSSSLERLASKALTRNSDIAASYDTEQGMVGAPRGAAVLSETDSVMHSDFKLTSAAGEATQDALMLRAQVSAGTHFPQHYLGDAGSANLATATSMELPVLKHVEARQQVFEDLFRWFIDRVIERAVDSGRITKELPAEKDKEEEEKPEQELTVARPEDLAISAAHEDQHEDEAETERDLSYEFNMPNPLKRLMSDVVSSASQMVQSLDPNGTNVDLSRLALMLILREGFDMQDAQDLVEEIFPPGYDPLAAMKALQGGGQAPPTIGGPDGINFFGPEAGLAGLSPEPSTVPRTKADIEGYGAKKQATPPEEVRQALVEGRVFGSLTSPGRQFFMRRRDGSMLVIDEAGRPLPDIALSDLMAREQEIDRLMDEEVYRAADDALTGLLVGSNNGTGE